SRRHRRCTRLPYTTLFRSDLGCAPALGSAPSSRALRKRGDHALESAVLVFTERRVTPDSGQRLLETAYNLFFLRQGIELGLTSADRKSTRLNSSHVKISYA